MPLEEQLSPVQKKELRELVHQKQDVLSSEPCHGTHIITEPGKGVKLRPYSIPEARRDAVCSELKAMFEAGVIEESAS